MELKNYIQAGIEKLGSVIALAKHLDQQDTAITNAKGHRRGLPEYACVMLADLLEVERIEVIAASELVTEKNPERQKVWLPFVLAAEARLLAQHAQTNAEQIAATETTKAPKTEPKEEVVVENLHLKNRHLKAFRAF